MHEHLGALSQETYTTRKSVLTRETTWRLTKDSLVREVHGEPVSSGWRTFIEIAWRILFPWSRPLGDESWPNAFPFEQIVSIRTRFDPTRFDLKRERCDLIDAQGRRVSLFSTRYVSAGNFADQSQIYAPFVGELTRRVIAARPQTLVSSGLSWPAYLTQHGLLLLAILALASVLAIAGVPGLALYGRR